MRQIGRDYRLVIGNPKTGEALEIAPPLHVEFTVKKYIDNRNNLNQATFRIYNLSKNSRTFFENTQYAQIVFSCGYVEAKNLAVIFKGQAVSVSTEYEGGDLVTVITAGESFIQLHNVIESETIAAGKTVADVVRAVVAKMQNVSLGSMAGEAILKKLPNGYPIEGTPREVLNALAKDLYIQWRCDKGVLSIRDNGGSFKTPDMQVFSLDRLTGLLGIPSYIDKRVGKVDKDATGLPGVEFVALLNPTVSTADIVQLRSESSQINGEYQIRELEFKGSFRGNTWTMRAECDELRKRNGNI